MTTKTPNYTAEMTAELEARYTSAETADERAAVVEGFAAEFGKATKSVVAKLVTMKVYIKPERASKKGGVKKADLVDAITALVPMAANDAESLTKATMNALKAVIVALSFTPTEDGEDAS